MSSVPTALWLSVSPILQRFNRPLISQLSQHHAIALWEYNQTPDEPITLDIALVLLHDYLKQIDHPVHLIGQGRHFFHYINSELVSKKIYDFWQSLEKETGNIQQVTVSL